MAERVGVEVVECACVIELQGLQVCICKSPRTDQDLILVLYLMIVLISLDVGHLFFWLFTRAVRDWEINLSSF